MKNIQCDVYVNSSNHKFQLVTVWSQYYMYLRSYLLFDAYSTAANVPLPQKHMLPQRFHVRHILHSIPLKISPTIEEIKKSVISTKNRNLAIHLTSQQINRLLHKRPPPSFNLISGPGNASVFGASAMDNSFVVLPKNRPPPPSTSTRTRPLPTPQPLGGSDDVAANLPNRPRATERWAGGGAQMRQNPEGVRGMEESFVVLPPGAGSMYGQEGRRGGGGSNGSNGGLDARMTALTKVFQIASHQTQVEGRGDEYDTHFVYIHIRVLLCLEWYCSSSSSSNNSITFSDSGGNELWEKWC